MRALITGLAGAVAAAALALSPPAHAMGGYNFHPGWYVTVDAGSSDITAQTDYSSSLFDQLNGVGASYAHSGSTSDTGYGLTVGYQASEYWGFDLGYFDFGKAYEDIHGTGAWSGTLNDEMKVRGITLMLVGTAPVTRHFAIVGKVGIIRSHAQLVTAAGGISGPGGAVSPLNADTSTNISFGYGLGLAWRFNQHFDLHIGWTQYRDVGAAQTGGNGNVNFTYLGVRFGF